jgi:DNA-directed RNA polymerase specialized sigma24 family protein
MDRLSMYFRHMRKILLGRGWTYEEAEDLMQEAFLRMQEYCERGGQVRQSEDLTLILDTSPTPDEVLAAEECLESMRVALDAVSRRTRDILFMHRLDGLSYAQIAQRAGLSISAVEKHIASALAILADANVNR